MGAAAGRHTDAHTCTHMRARTHTQMYYGWQSVGVLFWLFPFSVKWEARTSTEREGRENVLGGLRRKQKIWGNGFGK